MLGWVAAVMETESPSQPSPAVIQRMCTSATAGFFCVIGRTERFLLPWLDSPFQLQFQVQRRNTAIAVLSEFTREWHGATYV